MKQVEADRWHGTVTADDSCEMPFVFSISSFLGSAPWFPPHRHGGFLDFGSTLVFAPLWSFLKSLRCLTLRCTLSDVTIDIPGLIRGC